MRFFVAIEPLSIIDPADVWRILKLHRQPNTYEVLPIHNDGFPIERTIANHKQTYARATMHGKRVLNRYSDAEFCGVVFRTAGLICRNKRVIEVPIDAVVALHRDGSGAMAILNDQEKDIRLPSSEGSKAELLDRLINFTLITLAGQYAGT